MDFKLTPEQEAFRKEVADFLKAEMTPGKFIEEAAQSPEQKAVLDDFLKKLAARRWLAISWPEEYNGGGRGLVDHAIFNEQMGYYHAPSEALVPVTIIGPAIKNFGTEQQKRDHLTRIASGEGVYWQVWTEPDSGSDLASLKTSAVRDGDDYVINGQKVFVGDGRPPDYFYLAARTDPNVSKHRGISIFLVDRHTPGINISFLEPVAGWMKNEVFFDDVRIPASSLMGELNNGWSHMRDTLSNERSGIHACSELRRVFDDTVELCHEMKRDGKLLIENEHVQNRLADLRIELDAWTALCWRVVHMQSTGLPVVAEASIVAVQRKDFLPRFQAALYDILGSYAILKRKSMYTLTEGDIEMWMRESIHTHGGGTPEIQRNVVAVRGLGLPR